MAPPRDPGHPGQTESLVPVLMNFDMAALQEEFTDSSDDQPEEHPGAGHPEEEGGEHPGGDHPEADVPPPPQVEENDWWIDQEDQEAQILDADIVAELQNLQQLFRTLAIGTSELVQLFRGWVLEYFDRGQSCLRDHRANASRGQVILARIADLRVQLEELGHQMDGLPLHQEHNFLALDMEDEIGELRLRLRYHIRDHSWVTVSSFHDLDEIDALGRLNQTVAVVEEAPGSWLNLVAEDRCFRAYSSQLLDRYN